MMYRSSSAQLAILALAFTASGVAMAQAAAPAPSPITANVSLTTNYKFRGQDQDIIGTGGYKSKAVKPALQGGFDYAHESGFYVGNWNSSVNWLPGNSIESDLYGGYKFKAGSVDLDVGLLGYFYPGNSIGNTTEIYGAASWSSDAVGALTLKYSHTVSKDYFGYAGTAANSDSKGRGTGYLNLAYSKEVFPKFTLKASLGLTRMSKDIRTAGYPSYVDYNVGGSYDLGGGLAVAASVQGANKKMNYSATTAEGTVTSPNKARLILALTKTF